MIWGGKTGYIMECKLKSKAFHRDIVHSEIVLVTYESLGTFKGGSDTLQMPVPRGSVFVRGEFGVWEEGANPTGIVPPPFPQTNLNPVSPSFITSRRSISKHNKTVTRKHEKFSCVRLQ